MGTTITKKELKDKELVKHHRDLLESFMINRLWGYSRRKNILKIYDNKISEDNIRFYICRPIKLFLTALITNQLDILANYFPKDYSFTIELV